MTLQNEGNLLVLDGLYCEEESCGGDELGEIVGDKGKFVKKERFLQLFYREQDVVEEDDELMSLTMKEKETHIWLPHGGLDGGLVLIRNEAVEWILKVKAHYGFNALTVVLAINYFDRYFSSMSFQRDDPLMGQLAAVACLSLAAKVEETFVPLLLDFQVEESDYAFEAKAVQNMELLVLSSRKWKMHPVTSLSFLHHIIRRLGLKINMHREFIFRCERLLLVLIADYRFISYLPSTLAAATMLCVIKEVEPLNHKEYKDQLMEILKISEDVVKECYKLVIDLPTCKENRWNKRKLSLIPNSPSAATQSPREEKIQLP